VNIDKQTILLVENEPYLQRTLVQALSSAFNGNVEIQVCINPESALAMTKMRSFDLMITEQSLPQTSGSDLISEVRQNLPDLPVILLSNFGSEMMNTNTLNIVDGFITKPFELTKFFHMVQSILESTTMGRKDKLDISTIRQPFAEKVLEEKKKPVKILIVEDDMGLLFIYRKALTKAGYKVFTASNILEAQTLLERATYDIFMCDIQLGRERGTDLLEQYGKELFQKGTQIIMVSAFGQYRYLTEDLGVEFFLEKPISLSTLLTMVERLTKKSKFKKPISNKDGEAVDQNFIQKDYQHNSSQERSYDKPNSIYKPS
jgi:DNA-binding NtrC family response regulator